MIKEAMLYEKLAGNKVKCNLCAHFCIIEPSKRGICGVRENREGILYTLVYALTIAENVDPIEKKPLFHFLPGSRSFSIATVGCNFRCIFCQNSDISQITRESKKIIGHQMLPQDVVTEAMNTRSKTIAYTYTEPTVFFEYAYETAKLAHESKIMNIFVTNGYMSEISVETIAPYLDAANVDLKSFRDDFYKKYCGARLQPVLNTLKKIKDLGMWLEITTLLIPSLNDSDEELEEIAQFIYSLGPETPWHISRFYPHYKLLNLQPTPAETIHKAEKIGRQAGLKYVYAGNLPGDVGENTFCSNCENLLIERRGFHINRINLNGTNCPFCGTKLDGII